VLSHFDLARKDCVGTARNRTSRVWYTVANGVLSDVYEPTIDTTNIETMQFIVTDGETFTDLQSRDMTETVSADATGMVCTVTSTANSGRYRLTTTYLTDPGRNSVVVRTQLTVLQGGLTRCNFTYASIHHWRERRWRHRIRSERGRGHAIVDERQGLVSYDTNTVTAAVAAITPCRRTCRCKPTGRSSRRRAATPAPRATAGAARPGPRAHDDR
jgi:GH15 family glucan-1,4-alpha-glucosidase